MDKINFLREGKKDRLKGAFFIEREIFIETSPGESGNKTLIFPTYFMGNRLNIINPDYKPHQQT